MAEQVLNADNWKIEANSVIKDIEKYVKDVQTAEGTNQFVYLNITTIEGNNYCVELSANGFRVVGKTYNLKDDTNEEYFETPYSLLHKISQSFCQSFSNDLSAKLNNLQEN